jgi:hypothetical protein
MKKLKYKLSLSKDTYKRDFTQFFAMFIPSFSPLFLSILEELSWVNQIHPSHLLPSMIFFDILLLEFGQIETLRI